MRITTGLILIALVMVTVINPVLAILQVGIVTESMTVYPNDSNSVTIPAIISSTGDGVAFCTAKTGFNPVVSGDTIWVSSTGTYNPNYSISPGGYILSGASWTEPRAGNFVGYSFNGNTKNGGMNYFSCYADSGGSNYISYVNQFVRRDAYSQSDTDFVATPVSGSIPLIVNFTDISINSTSSWSWDFGDGSTGSTKNISHIYQNPGSYTISLVTDRGTALKTNYITVTAESTDHSSLLTARAIDGPNAGNLIYGASYWVQDAYSHTYATGATTATSKTVTDTDLSTFTWNNGEQYTVSASAPGYDIGYVMQQWTGNQQSYMVDLNYIAGNTTPTPVPTGTTVPTYVPTPGPTLVPNPVTDFTMSISPATINLDGTTTVTIIGNTSDVNAYTLGGELASTLTVNGKEPTWIKTGGLWKQWNSATSAYDISWGASFPYSVTVGGFTQPGTFSLEAVLLPTGNYVIPRLYEDITVQGTDQTRVVTMNVQDASTYGYVYGATASIKLPSGSWSNKSVVNGPVSWIVPHGSYIGWTATATDYEPGGILYGQITADKIIDYPMVKHQEAANGTTYLDVYVRKNTNGQYTNLDGATVVVNPQGYTKITPSSGLASFSVPVVNTYSVTVTKQGYNSLTRSITVGSERSGISMELSSITVAPTVTVTGTGGGATAAPTIDYRTNSEKDRGMMNQIRDSAPELISVCILVTFLYLLGFKL